MIIAPNYPPDEGDWICECCGSALEQRKVQVRYLESAFEVSLPCCPACKRTLVPKTLAEGKMAEVEALLEDK